MADFELIKLTFDGGIAALGRVHLYEYSRSQYALSRFITVVEQYRRTGEIIERVTAGRTVDMIVSAPVRGSFGLEVLVPVLAPVAQDLAGTSFKGLFSYVWAKLLPPSPKRDDMAVDLARIELEREVQRTRQIEAQQSGETERLKVVRDIVQRQGATTEQMIGLVDRALEAGDRRTLERGYPPDALIREREMLIADQQREQIMEAHEHEIEQFDPRELSRLTSKVRPLVGDIGLPLRRSAERCSIGDASNDNAFIRLDSARWAQVNTRDIDENEFEFTGVIRSYDRFTGRGKIESPAFEKTVFFTVEIQLRRDLRDVILEAMRRREVVCRCASYRDQSGNVTSLILRGIDI